MLFRRATLLPWSTLSEIRSYCWPRNRNKIDGGVVGDLIGSGEQHERGIVGETPNLASRLQGVAEPDTVTLDCAFSLNQPVTNCHGRDFTF
jgi:hypothetical protein